MAALSNHSLPTDCQRDDQMFCTVVPREASHHIPTGRCRLHEEPVPAEILDMMNRRDDLCKRDPTSPELPRLNKDIQNRICVYKQQQWRDFVETMDQWSGVCVHISGEDRVLFVRDVRYAVLYVRIKELGFTNPVGTWGVLDMYLVFWWGNVMSVCGVSLDSLCIVLGGYLYI